MATISFNGKTYNSLDEMPADQRAAYEHVMAFMKDENNNGIPDMFEGDVIQKMIGMASTSVIVNGQGMQSIESLSPEAREKFNKAMAKLGQLGIFPPGMQSVSSQPLMQTTPQMAPSEPAFTQSPSFIQSSPSAISEDSGSRSGIIIGVVAAIILCAFALAAVALLFLNR